MTTPLLAVLVADVAAAPEDAAAKFIRLLTVFLLAMWVGF